MVVVIEETARGSGGIARVHGPFQNEDEACDYARKHLGGISGPWFWEYLVKLAD